MLPERNGRERPESSTRRRRQSRQYVKCIYNTKCPILSTYIHRETDWHNEQQWSSTARFRQRVKRQTVYKVKRKSRRKGKATLAATDENDRRIVGEREKEESYIVLLKRADDECCPSLSVPSPSLTSP